MSDSPSFLPNAYGVGQNSSSDRWYFIPWTAGSWSPCAKSSAWSYSRLAISPCGGEYHTAIKVPNPTKANHVGLLFTCVSANFTSLHYVSTHVPPHAFNLKSCISLSILASRSVRPYFNRWSTRPDTRFYLFRKAQFAHTVGSSARRAWLKFNSVLSYSCVKFTGKRELKEQIEFVTAWIRNLP